MTTRILTLPALLLALCAMFAGCTSTALQKPSDDGPYKGDVILYHAERTLPVIHATIDGFLAWEHQHRALLREQAPEVIRLADRLRRETPPALRDAAAAIGAYRAALEAGGAPPAAEPLNAALATVDRLAQAALAALVAHRR